MRSLRQQTQLAAGPEPTHTSHRDRQAALVPIQKKNPSPVSVLSPSPIPPGWVLHPCLLGRPFSQATPRLKGLHSPFQEQTSTSRCRACLGGGLHSLPAMTIRAIKYWAPDYVHYPTFPLRHTSNPAHSTQRASISMAHSSDSLTRPPNQSPEPRP